MEKQEWNVNKLLIWSIDYFKNREIPNPRLSAELLLSAVLNLSRMELYLKYDYVLSNDQLKKYREFILRRLKHEPIQYITGESYFRKIRLSVNKNVLIPRPETELLVEKAKQIITQLKNLKKEEKKAIKNNRDQENHSIKTINILEVGTGSGAIAISLLFEAQSDNSNEIPVNITATEINKDAAEVAKANAAAVLDGERFLHLKIINCNIIPENDRQFMDNFAGKFDIVISNPPYISEADFNSLDREIKEYEPREALISGKTGLDCYKSIIKKTMSLINPQKAYFIFETDPRISQNLKKVIEDEFKNSKIEIERDYNNLERILTAEVKML
ncbi:MAG: peptide chain release factor N(5)-glutamine methyltransferase [Actinobacteria bacterium]|nr:peptide chain release factor N(5)-glutamine methyltransferase [Actinomycetota bacterium]